MLLLSKLRWDLTAITGFDYVDHLITRLGWSAENRYIRTHSHTLVAICYTGKSNTFIIRLLQGYFDSVMVQVPQLKKPIET